MMNLGQLSKHDLSHNYARGSFLAVAKFSMEGLTFVARRFVRTDSIKIDSIDLYIAHESNWCEDYVKRIDPKATNLSRVDLRALHLLAIASLDPTDFSDRVAQLEME